MPDSMGRRHASPPAALELSGVAMSYLRPFGPKLVLADNFNLLLDGGQMHCLAGRSGSGKTTLLRIAAGLQQPTDGTVSWSGARIDGLSRSQLAEARRRHMGYVDQGATTIGELRVIDNVLLPAIPTGIDIAVEARAHALLELFGLAEQARQQTRTLSGGERQRVAIARSLLLAPTTIAVDEPTASLDRESATRVIAALRAAANLGSAILLASHDPALIAEADSVTRLE